VASALNLFRGGAVGFIDWLDVFETLLQSRPNLPFTADVEYGVKNSYTQNRTKNSLRSEPDRKIYG